MRFKVKLKGKEFFVSAESVDQLKQVTQGTGARRCRPSYIPTGALDYILPNDTASMREELEELAAQP